MFRNPSPAKSPATTQPRAALPAAVAPAGLPGGVTTGLNRALTSPFEGFSFALPAALGKSWPRLASQAAGRLRVPLAFIFLAVLFVLLQALVDRRDHKIIAAPEHADEDSVGFK